MKLVVTDSETLLSCGDISLDVFSAFGDVTIYDSLSAEQLPHAVADADGILCNKTPITASLLEQCQKLRYIGLFATGYNNIDLAAAKARGITVCNAGAYSTDAVAQHTFALILHAYNGVAKMDAAVRNGAWRNSRTFSLLSYSTQELTGKTISVIGYGSIGKKVAAIADAFGMQVLVSTRTFPRDCPYSVVSLDEAFRMGDIVTLHTPLTAQTAHMVNAERLRQMKPNALLVNTARGGLIVESDLAQALRNHTIAAAALDVLEKEPMGETPLAGLENCTITPHAAWSPLETRQRVVKIAAENLRLWLAGTPQNVIV